MPGSYTGRIKEIIKKKGDSFESPYEKVVEKG
jgi:hypothetical protein